MKRICDCMHRGTITCRLDDSAEYVANLMNDNQIRTVVVVDERGGYWGVISVMELLPIMQKDFSKIRAEEIMRPCDFLVDPQLSCAEAVKLMEKHQTEYLVISDQNTGEKRPIGIVTSYDIVRSMARIHMGRTVMGPLRILQT